MTRCANLKCRALLSDAQPEEMAFCGPCSVQLFQKMMLEPSEDPTALRCKVCGSFYELNTARVRRAIEDPHHGDEVTPELCWVCARLRYSAHQEAN